MSVYIADATDDYWTCDRWMHTGVWTTKVYALTGTAFDSVPSWMRVPWILAGRRGCITLNPTTTDYCRRCGMPREAKA